MKFSQSFNLRLPKELIDKRDEYKRNGVPCALPETLNYLTLVCAARAPKEILEIGTAMGISGIAMLVSSSASLTTIERDEDAYLEAKRNFEYFGLSDRVRQFLGDAGDVINFLDKKFDFIFLDGSKARYFDYLFDIKRLLSDGGVLFADNVLFRGYIDGEVKYRHSDNTIVRNMRNFLSDFLGDEDYICSVSEIGDGVLIAVKRDIKNDRYA